MILVMITQHKVDWLKSTEPGAHDKTILDSQCIQGGIPRARLRFP